MAYRTLIFDLDGTISDPAVGISRSINYALDAFSYDPIDEQRIHRMIGPPLTEIFAHFLGELPDSRMRGLVDAYRERYAAIGFTENVLYDDMPAVVEELHGRGYQLGVCTSKRADYASRIVDMFGLGRFFGFIDGGDVHVKKYMQLEQLVANGIDAASTAMIGDRAVDIDAASRNGISSIGVSWGFGQDDELTRAAPDFLVNEPTELLEIF